MASVFLRICSVSVLSVLVGCTQAATPKGPNLPVGDILGPAEQRYTTCQSYQDSGTLHQTLRSETAEEPTRSTTSFRTAFVRKSGKFYFDYTTTHERFIEPDHAVIWRTAPGLARMWWSVKPGEVKEEELLGALVTFGGVSSGLTRLVPSWLVDNRGKIFSFQYRLDGDENVRGAPSFRLSALERERSVSLWLRKSDYALVRFASNQVVHPTSEPPPIPDTLRQAMTAEQLERFLETSKHPFVSEETIDLEPAFDAAVDESVFGFSPPTQGATP